MSNPTRNFSRTAEAIAVFDAHDATFDKFLASPEGQTNKGVKTWFAKSEELAEAVGIAYGHDTADVNSMDHCRSTVRPGPRVPQPGAELSHVRKAVANWKERMSELPGNSCEACRQIYWACACGSAPNGAIAHRIEDAPPKPTRCMNIYHNPPYAGYPNVLTLKDIRICCQRHNHHVGSTCAHCGQKG